MLEIYLILSVLLFLTGIVGACVSSVRKSSTLQKTLSWLIAGTSLALLPLYFNGNADVKGGVPDRIISAVLGVIRSMTGENSVADTRGMLGELPTEISAVASFYTAVLHLMAVCLLLGVILSLLNSFFPRLRFILSLRGHLYIFNTLSERGVLLAEDIHSRRVDNKSVFVFLDILNADSKMHTELKERIRAINGFIFNESPSALAVPRALNKQTVDMFLLEEDKANLKDAILLTEKYSSLSKASVKLHLLCNKPESVAVVDSIKHTQNIMLRLICENTAMLYHLFDTRPLFLGAREGKLSVLIVGAGQHGSEAVKTASWCAQTLKLKPEIIIVDKNPLVEKRLERDCPELMPRTAPPFAKSECSVKFYCAEAESVEFTEIMRKNPQIGYVICSLGDEELNLRAALHIRSVYEEIRFSKQDGKVGEAPIINALITDPFLYETAVNMSFGGKVGCNISVYGSLKDTYTWENIAAPYLDSAGMAFNRFYACHFSDGTNIEAVEQKADESYEEREYNRASSRALGLHAKYKLYAALEETGASNSKIDWSEHPSAETIALLEEKLKSKSLVEELSKLEHRRWDCYVRSQGWRCVSTDTMERYYSQLGTGHRNFAAKLTPCLVPWEELESLDKAIEGLHTEAHNEFQGLDRIMIP